ncbi:MAG: MBL fold metallo-hydrolase [Acidobacteriota bacterium]
MKLTVMGSADAFSSAGRGNSCYWLDDAAPRPFMVDFGPTALQAVQSSDRGPDELAGLALTHLHGDHFGGFAVLHVCLAFQARRTEPFVVLGPTGTRDKLESLLDLTYGPSVTDKAQFDIEYHEIAPGESTTVLGARVEAFAAEHLDPPEQALCLRVTGGDGAVVAFSGDTAPCDGLEAAADGADLLVAECSSLRPPAGRHCTWEAWQEMAQRFRCRKVLLTHLGPDVREEVPAALAENPPKGPPMTLADDGMVLEVKPEA